MVWVLSSLQVSAMSHGQEPGPYSFYCLSITVGPLLANNEERGGGQGSGPRDMATYHISRIWVPMVLGAWHFIQVSVLV